MGDFFFCIRQVRKNLLEFFWEKIRDFSSKVSATTLLISDHTVDYFDILKNRMDKYLNSLSDVNSTQDEPVVIVGTKFAKACSLEGDWLCNVSRKQIIQFSYHCCKKVFRFCRRKRLDSGHAIDYAN